MKKIILWVGQNIEYAKACRELLEKITRCAVCLFYDDIELDNANIEWRRVSALIIHTLTLGEVFIVDDIINTVDWVKNLDFFSGKLFILTRNEEEAMAKVAARLRELAIDFDRILPDMMSPEQLSVFIAANLCTN